MRAAPGAIEVLAGLLALARCGPLVVLLPLGGLVVRLVSAGVLVSVVAPLLGDAASGQLRGLGIDGAGSLWQLTPLFARELLVGSTLALGALLPILVARSAGALVDAQLPLAEHGREDDRAPGPVTRLYGLLALALFFGLGGARILCAALSTSYQLLPPAVAPLRPTAGVLLVGKLLGLALWLGLPVLAAQLGAQLALGLILRVLAPAGPDRRHPGLASLLWLLGLLLGTAAVVAGQRSLLGGVPALLRDALDGLTR